MSETSTRLRRIAEHERPIGILDRLFLRSLALNLESQDLVPPAPGRTLPSDPRIPVGTRVRFTERLDGQGTRYYQGARDGTGVVIRDDGSHEVPYKFQREGSDRFWDFALADYNELEILP